MEGKRRSLGLWTCILLYGLLPFLKHGIGEQRVGQLAKILLQTVYSNGTHSGRVSHT